MTPLWLAVLGLLLATLLCLVPPLLRRPPPTRDDAADSGLRAFTTDDAGAPLPDARYTA